MAYRIYGVAAALMLSIGAALAESGAESSAEAAREALRDLHAEVQAAERTLDDRRSEILRESEKAAAIRKAIVKTRIRLQELTDDLDRLLEEDERYRDLLKRRREAQDRFQEAVKNFKK